MQNISEIEELIKLISKLPGLGPKSAKRIVLKLINNRDELVKPMANTLVQVYKNVVEDLIIAAHNNAKSQLKIKTSEEISKATGGLGVPGFKWPL